VSHAQGNGCGVWGHRHGDLLSMVVTHGIKKGTAETGVFSVCAQWWISKRHELQSGLDRLHKLREWLLKSKQLEKKW
jgi:hypothetical protein